MVNVLGYLENAAKKHPDRKAVRCGDQSYTFRELRDVSRGIGAALGGYHVRGKAVGVLAARDIHTLVFFMGAVYAGAFYVPIDPDMPAEKKQAVIDDARFPVILGTRENRCCIEGLSFEGDYLTLSCAEGAECTFPDNGGDDPLYMVYTSGSTGKPKGVLKSHAAEISFIEAYADTFAFSEDEVIGSQTPFFFDASAKDIYLMLRLGCSIEILPTQLFAFPVKLIEYMNEKKVTFASWVPTALSIVAQLNTFTAVKPETLRRVFFVGEVIPVKHLNTWMDALPGVQFVNLYGSSEIAGICCWYEVKKRFEKTDTLPMGKALSNCRVYLADEGGVITEPGRIGELYVVSDALALGYYNDPEKTGKAFLIRDFGEGPVRCLKTGDLAQYDGEGDLLFASRTDHQIKHLGHRIELGEIEAAAGALDEVRRCCCLYNAVKQRITLFCEVAPECGEIKGTQITAALKGRLSAYMVPGRVVILDALPLSPNGKIDRQKLKEML